MNQSKLQRLSLCALLVIGSAGAQAVPGAERVVSVGGSITEIIYALNRSSTLVAVDSTSQYPAEARELPNVGYMRQLAAEPIVALKPTLVVVIEGAGPSESLVHLRAAGLRVEQVTDDPSPEGVIDKVRAVGELLDARGPAHALASQLRNEFEQLNRMRQPASPRVLFLLPMGSGSALAGGRNSSAAGIIQLAGGQNAVTAFEGYKALAPEAALSLMPDVVLVTHRGLHQLGGIDKLLALPWLSATPAARGRRVVAMDGLLLLGFGPRTPQAALQLSHALAAPQLKDGH